MTVSALRCTSCLAPVEREHTGLGLKDAKDLVEAAPCALTEGWDPARAERFRAALRAVGAIVE